MNKLVFTFSVLVLAAACEQSTVATSPTPPSLSKAAGPSSQRDTLRRGGTVHSGRRGGGFTGDGPTGDMTFHSGSIMPSTVTYAIFWGARWAHDQGFVGDKITGMTSFFQGIGGSKWLNVLRQYPDGVSQFTTHSTWMGYYLDTLSEPPPGEASDYALQTEVCAVLAAHGVQPRSDAIYVVYDTAVSPLVDQFGDRIDGHHNYGACNSTTIEFAVVYNVLYTRTNDSRYHSKITSDLADVTAHEVAETINDPLLTGWYTLNTGGEIGDKCNLAYSPTSPYVTLSNGSIWKIQGLWSNSANDSNSGYANLNNELGCLMENDVIIGPFTLSGTLSGSSPVASWTVPSIANGDAVDTRYTVYRTTSVGGSYEDQDDPIATNYQGTTYLDLSRTVVGYNGTSNPGPHYDWVSYRIVASNGQTNQTTSTVYFKCGAFGRGC